MDNITVVVLANPNEPQLAMLEALPPETGIVVGNSPEAFARAAREASIILTARTSRLQAFTMIRLPLPMIVTAL